MTLDNSIRNSCDVTFCTQWYWNLKVEIIKWKSFGDGSKSFLPWNVRVDKSCGYKCFQFRFDVWFALKHIVAVSSLSFVTYASEYDDDDDGRSRCECSSCHSNLLHRPSHCISSEDCMHAYSPLCWRREHNWAHWLRDGLPRSFDSRDDEMTSLLKRSSVEVLTGQMHWFFLRLYL